LGKEGSKFSKQKVEKSNPLTFWGEKEKTLVRWVNLGTNPDGKKKRDSQQILGESGTKPELGRKIRKKVN